MTNYLLHKTTHGVYHVLIANTSTVIGEIQPCNDGGIIFYRAVYPKGAVIISDLWPTKIEAMAYIVRLYED